MGRELRPGQLVAAKTPRGLRLGAVTGRHHTHQCDGQWHSLALAEGDGVRLENSPRNRLIPVRLPGPVASLCDLRPEDAEATDDRDADELGWWIESGEWCRP